MVFLALWAGLGIIALLLHFFASPAVKRAAMPWFAVLVGAAFLVFLYGMTEPGTFVFTGIPVAALTLWYAIAVTYCPSCGAMNRNPRGFPPPRTCSRCGSSL